MRARRNRGRRFRVELYIDALDQNKTKRIFDQIYQHKDMLESVLGDVSWERIDDKRASRIAQYCPGDIASHQRGNELIGGSCAHATRLPCELLCDTFVLE